MAQCAVNNSSKVGVSTMLLDSKVMCLQYPALGLTHAVRQLPDRACSIPQFSTFIRYSRFCRPATHFCTLLCNINQSISQSISLYFRQSP